jgi:protein-tyrosine sulfotransferase
LRLSGEVTSSKLMLDEPVVVLTCARSGSTLLRMVLDAHPDLACPPETNIGKICASLAEMWVALDPACTRVTLTPAARQHVRGMVDAAFGSYLTRVGKRRWCEKSLAAVDVADKFLELYENTKFICLYRHAMDVASSALEASPWGLYGYGFEPYARSNPTNTVSAIISYWMDITLRTLEFEEAHQDRCLRVHYEELVSAPERVASQIFEFLGMDQVPGISKAALGDHSRPDIFGWGDHKIRASDEISTESVGRGVGIPHLRIPPPQLQVMNQALERLGYTKVDLDWQMSTTPPTLLRLPTEDATAAPESGEEEAWDEPHPAERLFTEVDAALSGSAAAYFEGRAADGPGRSSFAIVAYSLTEPRVAQAWRFDLDSGKVSTDVPTEFAALAVDWLMTGPVNVWRSLIEDDQNVAACLRSGSLRCIGRDQLEPANGGPERGLMDRRIRAVTELLRIGHRNTGK